MGLVVNNLKYKDYLDDISFRIGNNRIFGIYGDNSKYILDIINGDISDYSGNIQYDKNEINESFYKNNSSSIALIDSMPRFYTNKVEEEFRFNLQLRKVSGDYDKIIKKFIGLVNLKENVLGRSINTLSRSEKYLLTIAVNLSFGPEVILFKNYALGLDHKNMKILATIINNLKEDHKLVIITSNDTNILYQYTDETLLLDNNQVYKNGQTDKIFTSPEIMKGGIIPMPSITKVTYLAKTKKSVKLSYHKDTRDIIKDIYKHV